jgi:hypothetical protein
MVIFSLEKSQKLRDNGRESPRPANTNLPTGSLPGLFTRNGSDVGAIFDFLPPGDERLYEVNPLDKGILNQGRSSFWQKPGAPVTALEEK